MSIVDNFYTAANLRSYFYAILKYVNYLITKTFPFVRKNIFFCEHHLLSQQKYYQCLPAVLSVLWFKQIYLLFVCYFIENKRKKLGSYPIKEFDIFLFFWVLLQIIFYFKVLPVLLDLDFVTIYIIYINIIKCFTMYYNVLY